MVAIHNSRSRSQTCQAPVFQKQDDAIHWINLYPVDKVFVFPNTYPLDSPIQRLNKTRQANSKQILVHVLDAKRVKINERVGQSQQS